MIKCSRCSKRKDDSKFSWRNKKKGKKLSWCKQCIKEYDHDRYRSEPYKTQKNKSKKAIRQRNMKIIHDHLKCGCIECGESRIPALQFDHFRDKKENVSCMLYHSVDALLEEIKKCEIRCANCHAVKTAEEQGWYSDYSL